MSLEQELTDLKRQRKRTHQMLMAVVIAGLSLFFIGQKGANDAIPEAIIAKSFGVVDNKGKLRISLAVSDQGIASVLFHDGKGNVRVGIVSEEDGESAIAIQNATGKTLIALEVKPDGTHSIRVADVNGNNRIVMMSADKDNTQFVVGDDKQKRIMIGVDKDAAGLIINDKNGAGRIFMATQENAAMSIEDGKGKALFAAP